MKVETIYCDFDGTITKEDAVNSFFEKFASPDWTDSEELWRHGKITSRENAIIQVGKVRKLSEDELFGFINSIEIDEYFVEFCDFLKSKNIKLVILSDGFDLFISETLKRLKITDVEFYANHVELNDNKLTIEFPYYNSSCEIGAGMCKCNKVKEKDFFYIGDGVSDLCVAKKARRLFAKKALLKYCEENDFKCIPFEHFENIMSLIKND